MKIPRQFRFLPPIFLVIFTILFAILCFKHCFLNLVISHHVFLVFVLLGVFSFSFLMWIWGLIILMFADPGTIEKEKKYCVDPQCRVRCIYCKSYKPYRTHHCSTCGICYARMDHHCIYLGRCIALRNHKTFLVFLFYSIINCLIWFLSSLFTISLCDQNLIPHLINIDVGGSFSLLILVCFLMYQELSNLVLGQTTLEGKFDIVIKTNKTKMENVEEIMGPFGVNWLLPTLTPTTTNAYQWEYLRGE